MLIIDDTRKCAVCDAYPDGRGWCANGHPQPTDVPESTGNYCNETCPYFTEPDCPSDCPKQGE